MRYTIEDLEKNNGQVINGRIAEYNRQKGYGHIYTEDRKDVFLSSYALGKLEKRISIGTKIKFIPKLIKEKICATDIEIVELFPKGRDFKMPNGKKVYIRDVQKFGIVSGNGVLKEIGKTKEEIEKLGLKVEDMKYLYIVYKNKELKYFDKKVPTNKIKINIEPYFTGLCHKYIYNQ